MVVRFAIQYYENSKYAKVVYRNPRREVGTITGKPVIVSAVRTPIGRFGGSLAQFTAPQLAAIAVKEAVARAGIEGELVDEVIFGNVLKAGLGQNPARQAAIFGGLPVKVGAFTVEKVCGSGMKSIMLAGQAIRAGDADCIVAGGMESMSNAPYLLPKARFGYRLFDGEIKDELVMDGLWDAYGDFHMGHTGDWIAKKYDISREEQDRFALSSHQKAIKAIDEGAFRTEIVPIEIPQKKGDPILMDTDEGPRRDTSYEKLARLKPFFNEDGTVTAGNASAINDVAAAVIVMSEEKSTELGIKPLARIVDQQWSGVEPIAAMTGPIEAIRTILERQNLTIDDIDLFEENEAFASQTLAICKEFDIPLEKTNVHGGAVALGHPIGASGTRIVVTLINAMQRYGKRRGLAALCIGGGNGTAMLLEREEDW
jgi:acetyl-CoA C-acetyltransferase